MEAVFLLAPASILGLWLGKKMDMMRIFDRIHAYIIPSITIGLALSIPGLVGRFITPQGDFGLGMNNPTPLEWLLRSLSTRLTEKIFFRLDLMTPFVWITRSILKKSGFNKPSLWIWNLLTLCSM
jgi:hypothetical protein